MEPKTLSSDLTIFFFSGDFPFQRLQMFKRRGGDNYKDLFRMAQLAL